MPLSSVWGLVIDLIHLDDSCPLKLVGTLRNTPKLLFSNRFSTLSLKMGYPAVHHTLSIVHHGLPPGNLT